GQVRGERGSSSVWGAWMAAGEPIDPAQEHPDQKRTFVGVACQAKASPTRKWSTGIRRLVGLVSHSWLKGETKKVNKDRVERNAGHHQLNPLNCGQFARPRQRLT